VAFVLNRAIRIYPTYWSCLAIAVTIGILFREAPSQLPFVSVAWPQTVGGWINNIAIFSFAPQPEKLIAQAWSLEVELYFYFVIGLCTYRSLLVTVACLLFTSVYAVLAILELTWYPFYWTS
jgi:peptidoglycan/LPS O-acetylase OafA/YrhL